MLVSILKLYHLSDKQWQRIKNSQKPFENAQGYSSILIRCFRAEF